MGDCRALSWWVLSNNVTFTRQGARIVQTHSLRFGMDMSAYAGFSGPPTHTKDRLSDTEKWLRAQVLATTWTSPEPAESYSGTVSLGQAVLKPGWNSPVPRFEKEQRLAPGTRTGGGRGRPRNGLRFQPQLAQSRTQCIIRHDPAEAGIRLDSCSGVPSRALR